LRSAEERAAYEAPPSFYYVQFLSGEDAVALAPGHFLGGHLAGSMICFRPAAAGPQARFMVSTDEVGTCVASGSR
jgi:hypothetical protein